MTDIEPETNEKSPLNGKEIPDIEEESNVKIDTEDHTPIRNFLLVIGTSLLQGLPLGLFWGSFTLILASKGVSFSSLGKLTTLTLPFAFKFILGPIVDTYYIERFGRRKTYIVPSIYIVGILFFVFSYYVEEYLKEKDVNTLWLVGIFVVCFVAIQAVATDAWIVSLFRKEKFPLASAFQVAFSVLGFLISFNIFLPLHEEGHLTVKAFMIGVAIWHFITAIFIQFFPEIHVHEYHNKLKEVLITFKQLWKNRNLRILNIIMLTYQIGFMSVASSYAPRLVKEGFKPETIANICSILLPILVILGYPLGKLIEKYKKNMHFLYCVFIYYIFFMPIAAYVAMSFDPDDNYTKTFYLILFGGLLLGLGIIVQNVAFNSYIYKITHKQLASTFITVMFSINNFGRSWPEILTLLLADYINPYVFLGFGIVFSIIYAIFVRKYMYELEDKKPSDFAFYLEEPQQEDNTTIQSEDEYEKKFN